MTILLIGIKTLDRSPAKSHRWLCQGARSRATLPLKKSLSFPAPQSTSQPAWRCPAQQIHKEVSAERAIKITHLQKLDFGNADQRLKLGGRDICIFELGTSYVCFC